CKGIAGVAACAAESAVFDGREEQGCAEFGVIADRVLIALDVVVPRGIYVDPLGFVGGDGFLDAFVGDEGEGIDVTEGVTAHLVPVCAFLLPHMFIVRWVVVKLWDLDASKSRC